MATFGAAMKTDTYAADALRATGALIDTFDEWSRERAGEGAPALRFGIGVAVGPVVFGAVGDDTRLEFTVIGDAVNLAAKLEKHTKAEAVRALATAAVLTAARGQGYAPDRDPEVRTGRAVEGIDDPLDLVVVA
ncbi:MAG: adenylate/guanylate cyclase domain-containing protein [Proteobacteria bacterium]|nr:adenylate/guanylate cyclase domain-containing protein [Pseudomonadota bacterium]